MGSTALDWMYFIYQGNPIDFSKRSPMSMRTSNEKRFISVSLKTYLSQPVGFFNPRNLSLDIDVLIVSQGEKLNGSLCGKGLTPSPIWFPLFGNTQNRFIQPTPALGYSTAIFVGIYRAGCRPSKICGWPKIECVQESFCGRPTKPS